MGENMNSFKKELDGIAKSAKALALKIEKVQKQYADMVKNHPKSPAKKAPSKKIAAKKTGKTAVDTVLTIISRSKKGVDSATVIKKAGFEKQKVYNIMSRLKKQGRIKAVDKGIYIKA